MTFSIYSCINSIVITSLLLSCICFFRKKFRFTRISEVYCFVLLYIISFLRLFLPLDFKITKGIPLRGIYSNLFYLAVYQKYEILQWKFSLVAVIFFVILCTSSVKIYFYIVAYFRTSRFINTFKLYNPKQITEITKKIQHSHFRPPKCIVLTHESVTEPLATGIFKKKILLPPIAFSDNELYFILLHEYIHLKKYDLFKKYIVDICCIFFWWIPFHEFVQRDIEQLIEIHCDLSIIQNTAEKKTYMEVLLNSVKHSAQQNHNKMVGSLSFAFKESPYSMTERFKLIVEKPHTKKWHNLVLIVIGSTLITLSYLLVPIPEYEPDPKEIELSGFTYITPDNTSLSIENGTYFLTTRDGTKLPVSANHAKHMIASGIKLQKGEE